MSAITRTEQGAMSLPEAEMMKVLQSSLYPGSAPDSIKMVLGYCRAAGLDPMQKPVHIVPMWDSKAKCMRDVIMPGIGLYRTQAARSGCAGVTEPEFGPDVTESIGGQQITFPAWCRVTVKRRLQTGEVVEFTAKEFWKENYAVKGGQDKSIAPNAMWTKRPYGQIAKCTEAQALRKAFPEIGGEPTADEMMGKTINEFAEEAASVGGPGQPQRAARNPQQAAAQNAPEGFADYESQHLDAMRNAAMNGADALAAAFQALPKGPHKAAFWQAHQGELKAAAAAASVVDADTGEIVE